MAENVGEDESEFGSVTSSQKSFLKNCPFADPESSPTRSSDGAVETDSYSTEILGNPTTPSVVRTPVLSLSTPISLDSINDEDVFRTPPENASLSSAAESEPIVRVSEVKPGGGSKLKSPSSKTETTPVSASPSLTVNNDSVLETKHLSDSEEPVTEVAPLPYPPSFAVDDVSRVTGNHSESDSLSPLAIGRTRVLENQPITASVSNTGVPKSPSTARVPGKHSDLGSPSPIIMVLENQPITASVSNTGVPKSPSTARVPGKHSDLGSPSPIIMVLENLPISDSVANSEVPKSPSSGNNLNLVSSSPSATEGMNITETNSPGDDDETAIPFKQVLEALLRNNGENLNERDEKVSYVEILKRFGLKFP